MIRFAWHQFRTDAAVALVGLGVVAVVLGATGPHLVNVYDTDRSQVTSTYATLQVAVVALTIVAPALLGAFFGAPLVARELETGTFRLAWTQSVTRSRWLVVKLALIGVAASLIAGGLGLMAVWWENPIAAVNENRFSPANFGTFGVVPFGYALFALALGATTGLLFRRTLPAMATTIVGYVGARLAVTYWVRPHFGTPLRLFLPLTHLSAYGFNRSPSGALRMIAVPPNLPNAWALSASIVDKAGNAPTAQFLQRACPALLTGSHGSRSAAGGAHTSTSTGLRSCVSHVAARFHEVVIYQPASRYWPFQVYETLTFLAIALALGALSVWWVRRRLV